MPVPARTRLRRPANQSLIGLYQMIYSMMLSRLLTGLPVYGGAMYLAGRAASIFLTGAGRQMTLLVDNRRRSWNIAAFALVLLAMLALAVFIPDAQLDMPKVWLLFATVTAFTVRDIVGWRLVRLSVRRGEKGDRAFFFYYSLLQAVIVIVPCALMLGTLRGSAAWMPVGGYALAAGIEVYIQLKSRAGLPAEPDGEIIRAASEGLKKAGSLNRYETISALTIAALQTTTILLYTFLAFTAEELLLCMAIGLGVTLLTRELSEWLIKRRGSRREPTNILLAGLFLWMYGLVIYIQMVLRGEIRIGNAYLSLAIATAGASACMAVLAHLETMMEEAAEFTGLNRAGLAAVHAANMESAAMLGQLAALGVLTVLSVFLRRDVPERLQLSEVLAGWQPLMMLPTLLTVLAAFLAAMKFPLSRRYERKLERMLHLNTEGGKNDALQQQLEDVVISGRKRPLGIQLIRFAVRLFMHVKWQHVELIEPDDDNPIVFLCNHGKFYGPLVGMVRMPVDVRPWVISEIAIDPQEFADYFYKYELADSRVIPARWKMPLATALGRISVWGMDELESIPVYRSKPTMLMKTMRLSVQALEAGDNLLVFPENPNALEEDHGYDLTGVGPLFSGFAMLGQIYYSRTGKRCRFQPMYVHKLAHTMTFAPPILYDPDNDPAEERERISAYAYSEMTRISEEEEKKYQERQSRRLKR